MFGIRILFGILAAGCASTAIAQDRSGSGRFVGPVVGIEGGLVEHHFYLEKTDLGSGEATGRYYRSWGAGGGLFAGYDIAIGVRTTVGLEAAFSIGGATNQAQLAGGSFYRATPRHGYRLVGRLGRQLGERVLVYATVGYGGHRFRVTTIGVSNAEPSGDSFVIGGGAEYRVSPRLAVRIDFKHLDNQANQLLVGLPVRF